MYTPRQTRHLPPLRGGTFFADDLGLTPRLSPIVPSGHKRSSVATNHFSPVTSHLPLHRLLALFAQSVDA